jgi:hypothetical protein
MIITVERAQKQEQMLLSDLIRQSLRDEYARPQGIETLLENHIKLTTNLLELLISKALISPEELGKLLPEDNFRKVISVADDWDYTRSPFGNDKRV